MNNGQNNRMDKKKYENNNFKGLEIIIDDKIYHNNTFEDCTLVYRGGTINFTNNVLIRVKLKFVIGPVESKEYLITP